MTWRERLIGLALAGGLASGCNNNDRAGSCNAVADPCCLQPDSGVCFNYHHPEAGVDAPEAPGVDAPNGDALVGEPPDAGAR